MGSRICPDQYAAALEVPVRTIEEAVWANRLAFAQGTIRDRRDPERLRY
jgi:hypothetical protein